MPSLNLDSAGEVPTPGGQSPGWVRAGLLTRRVQFALDLTVLVSAFGLAYLLRFDFAIPEPYRERALIQLPVVVMVQFIALTLTRVYAFVWRYIGLRELGTFARAAAWSAIPLLILRLGVPERFEAWRIPLSVVIVDTVLGFGGLVALRVLRRTLYERYERAARARRAGEGRRKRTLLVGAGRAGVLAVREIRDRGDTDLEVVGFVDDDPLKQGMVIQGVRVVGATRDLPRLARELQADQAVVTIADAEPPTIQRIVEACQRVRLEVRTIPGLYEVLQGKVSISRFREIQVEDLLGRDPVRLDEGELERFLTGRSVMVTGAGGSIGSELARQIARFRPSRLLLYERAEFALFEIDRELRGLWPDLAVVPLVGDVGDAERVRGVFEQGVPDVVFHAAAHKHVPLMESSPAEAVRNNVFGTEVLGRLAGEHGVAGFVLISTDKAVRPSSVMGTSKRLAELVVQDLDRRFPNTRYEAVRFGNVLGSAGSVIQIFREQISRGGPVTVTHPDMKRYFMTIPEAAQLVLQAGAMGTGGEIFVLDMGEPVSILELARQLVRLSGFVPGEDVKIVFTGSRPGEKLFEEIALEGEAMDRTRHPKIYIGRVRPYPPERMAEALSTLRSLITLADPLALRTYLAELVPEARLETGAPAEIEASKP
jgi:FlaA1/EpsC-like NDP-sugar epimerase